MNTLNRETDQIERTLPKSQTKIIDCEAVPIESAKEKPLVPSGVIWALLGVLAVVKLSLALVLSLFFIRRFPRLAIGSVIGAGLWLKKRNKSTTDG